MTPTDAERRAWQILIGAFTVFLLLCSGAVYALQWFVFQSTIPLKATLFVARGTARMTTLNAQEPLAVTDSRTDLEVGTSVQTDVTSQAVITFYEPGSLEPIASVAIYRDSQIRIDSMSSPRFSFNPNGYEIKVWAEPGRGHIAVVPGIQRPITFELETAHATSDIEQPSMIAFDVTDQRTQLGVIEGASTISSRAISQKMTFKKGSRVSIDRQSSAVTTQADEVGLITNSDFSRPYSIGWKAYDSSDPIGSAYNSRIDGQNVLVIDRSQDKWPNLTLNHGETGLSQTLDVDVSQMTTLEMRITLYIDEQNLSTCGVVGSECPLMYKLVYTDPTGAEQTYIHGFYANHDPSLSYPLLCDTCRAEHERINPRRWYTYSENLLALIPQEQRPITLKTFSIYASGHAYKVYISEANLIGARPTSSP